jgi:hypothetical protein
MNFVFTEKLLREHFSDDIVSELVPKEHIPPLSEADSQYLTTVAQLAKEMVFVEFLDFVRHPSNDVSEQLGRMFQGLSCDDSLWHNGGDEAYKTMNKKTHLVSILNPIHGAFFSGLSISRLL